MLNVHECTGFWDSYISVEDYVSGLGGSALPTFSFAENYCLTAEVSSE